MDARGPSSAGQQSNLFALVDRLSVALDAGTQQRLDSLSSSATGINLYADLIGTALIDTGPLLHAVHEEDLDAWTQLACDTTAIGFLCGDISQPDLVHHLQSLREVALPDGSLALFRFQDSHVATHLWPLLSPGQGNQILGRIGWWAVPDVCGSWSALTPAAGHRRAGALRFDHKVFERLNEQLLVYTVAEQVREVDSALLHGLTACQSRTLLRSRLQAARDLGLTTQSDRALYVVLSMQLPVGFESELPFSEALDRSRKGVQTFGDALDNVPAAHWEP